MLEEDSRALIPNRSTLKHKDSTIKTLFTFSFSQTHNELTFTSQGIWLVLVTCYFNSEVSIF